METYEAFNSYLVSQRRLTLRLDFLSHQLDDWLECCSHPNGIEDDTLVALMRLQATAARISEEARETNERFGDYLVSDYERLLKPLAS